MGRFDSTNSAELLYCSNEKSAHFLAEERFEMEGDPKTKTVGDVEVKSNSSNIKVLMTPNDETKEEFYNRMFQESVHFINMQKSCASLASHRLPHSASLPGQVDSHKQCDAHQTSSSALFKNATFKTIDIEYPDAACTGEFTSITDKQQHKASDAAAPSVTMVYESASEAQEGPDVTTLANNIDMERTNNTSIVKASKKPFDEMKQCYGQIFDLLDVTDEQKAKQAGDVEVRGNASSTKIDIPPYEEMKQNPYHHMFQEPIHHLTGQKSRVTLASLEIDTESTDESIPATSEDSLQRLVAEDSTIIAVDIDGNVIRADDESASSDAVSVEGLIEDLQKMMAKPAKKSKEIDPENAGEDTSPTEMPFGDDSSVNESETPADHRTGLYPTDAHSIEEADPEKAIIGADKVASHSSLPVSEAAATHVNKSDTPADSSDAPVHDANATKLAPAVDGPSVKEASLLKTAINNANVIEVAPAVDGPSFKEASPPKTEISNANTAKAALAVDGPLIKEASPPETITNNANVTAAAPAVDGPSVKEASPTKAAVKAAKSAITAKVPVNNSRGESQFSSSFQLLLIINQSYMQF